MGLESLIPVQAKLVFFCDARQAISWSLDHAEIINSLWGIVCATFGTKN